MTWNSILFYSNLYDKRKWPDKQNISSYVNDLTNVSYLAEERSNVCEGILRYDECYVLIDWVGGPDGKRFGSRSGRTVNNHFIIWPLWCWKFCLNVNMTQMHNIRRPRSGQRQKGFHNKRLSLMSSPWIPTINGW